MPISIDNPRYRTDEQYMAYHVQRSRRNRGKALGGDIYQEPKTINSPWIDAGARKFTIDGTQLVDTTIVFDVILQPRNTYIVSMAIKDYVAGNLSIGNADDSKSFNALGNYEFEITTYDELDLLITADANYNGSVTINTIKRIA